MFIAVLGLTLYLTVQGRDWFDALTQVTFNVVSIITTCGYASEDYSMWGTMAFIAFFYLTFSGGCAGSTSGGLKIFRSQLSFYLLIRQLRLLIHPNAVFVQHYAGKRVDDQLLGSVLSFCFIFFATIALLAFVLSLFGLDPVTSITGAATAVSNVGPGLGDVIGPAGNFAPLPDGAKLALSLGMLLGRLEILTLLVLFVPMYWRY
ncbi:potassium transporter TrkG [Alkalimonas mucilaginosa]|uniref:Potassium transporter TrkG n=1 Tax=Alkalimonas mucilaginosa TaxID=3057676 RepID=A0ABU7JIT1_9GAMM|nr:potassium transporter TrkG [Alkalimonas sp. MEB004]MEE2025604.1 potassium transporter TrkG [Alkalimonas sp. MEB004]